MDVFAHAKRSLWHFRLPVWTFTSSLRPVRRACIGSWLTIADLRVLWSSTAQKLARAEPATATASAAGTKKGTFIACHQPAETRATTPGYSDTLLGEWDIYLTFASEAIWVRPETELTGRPRSARRRGCASGCGLVTQSQVSHRASSSSRSAAARAVQRTENGARCLLTSW